MKRDYILFKYIFILYLRYSQYIYISTVFDTANTNFNDLSWSEKYKNYKCCAYFDILLKTLLSNWWILYTSW